MLLIASLTPSLFFREFGMLAVVRGLVGPLIIKIHRFDD